MLNQFISGLQPELARSVSLQYPKSITQVVSLAETTELVVKASRCPASKASSGGNQSKGPNQSNWGRGFWRGGSNSGRGQSGSGRNMGNFSGRGRGAARRRGGRGEMTNFHPLACCRCGVHGHLARDCPSTNSQLMGSSASSSSRGAFSKSKQKGSQRGRGRGR